MSNIVGELLWDISVDRYKEDSGKQFFGNGFGVRLDGLLRDCANFWVGHDVA